MAEWKPEYDNVPTVKRRGDRPEGPDEGLTSGSGCLVGFMLAVGIGLLLIVATIMSALH